MVSTEGDNSEKDTTQDKGKRPSDPQNTLQRKAVAVVKQHSLASPHSSLKSHRQSVISTVPGGNTDLCCQSHLCYLILWRDCQGASINEMINVRIVSFCIFFTDHRVVSLVPLQEIRPKRERAIRRQHCLAPFLAIKVFLRLLSDITLLTNTFCLLGRWRHRTI